MSYNGSGTFVINTAGQPVVSGTVISSTAFNALTADLATGLSTAITKDGQTTPTANIPMGNNKITGLAVGTAATDAANLSQVQSTVSKLINSISGADTITGTMSPTLGAYATGQMFYFVAAGTNTGAVTLNIDSLGAKAVTRDGSTALTAGDLRSGEVIVVVYDGTRFQVVSQVNSGGDATFANVSITSALNVGGVATVTGGATLNGGVVINEPGADADTRIEGDTDANLFFADASTDRIGIGTSSPLYKFNVAGTSGTVGLGLTGTHASGDIGINIAPSAITGSYTAINSAPSASTGVVYNFGNGNNSSSSAHSRVDILTTSANGGDPKLTYTVSGVLNWCLGVDNSDSDKFKISASDAPGTSDLVIITSGGDVGVNVTTPAQKLHVLSATNYQGLLVNGNSAPSVCFAGSTNTTPAWKVGLSGNNGANFSISAGAAADDKVTVTSGGAFLVNATSPASANSNTFLPGGTTADDVAVFAKHAASNGNCRGYISQFANYSGNDGFFFIGNRSTGDRIYIYSSGDVANTNNSYGAISDEKVKQDITDASSQWDDVKNIRVRKFRFKNEPTGHLHIGVVAQELEQVSPGLIDEHPDYEQVEITDEDGNVTTKSELTGTSTKSVKYSVLYMKAIKALQEAMSRIESLEAKVAALEAK